MKTMGSKGCDKVAKEIKSAMDKIAKKHGLKIKYGRFSYTDEDVSVKVTARLGNAVSPEVANYNIYKDLYDLPKLGTKIMLSGMPHTVKGFKSRAKKYPIIVTDTMGQEYVITLEMLRASI